MPKCISLFYESSFLGVYAQQKRHSRGEGRGGSEDLGKGREASLGWNHTTRSLRAGGVDISAWGRGLFLDSTIFCVFPEVWGVFFWWRLRSSAFNGLFNHGTITFNGFFNGFDFWILLDHVLL